MSKANDRYLFTQLPGKKAPVHPAVGWIVDNSPVRRANNIYSPGSDKLTEVQLYISTLCQTDSRVTRVFSDVEKSFLYFLTWQ